MKKYIIIILVVLAGPWVAAGQVPGDFNAMFRKYSGQENYTTMELTGALLQMLTGDKDGSFKGLSTVKLITTEKGGSLGSEIRTLSNRNGYQTLMNLSEGAEGFEILHKEKGKGRPKDIAGYVMLAVDGASVTMIYLEGDIDFRNIAKLAKIEINAKK